MDTAFGYIVLVRNGKISPKYELDEGEHTIGSSRLSSICLMVANPKVLDTHAIILVNHKGIATIVNKSKECPVTVNDKVVERVKTLVHGDVINVVEKKFCYYNEDLRNMASNKALIEDNNKTIMLLKRKSMPRLINNTKEVTINQPSTSTLRSERVVANRSLIGRVHKDSVRKSRRQSFPDRRFELSQHVNKKIDEPLVDLAEEGSKLVDSGMSIRRNRSSSIQHFVDDDVIESSQCQSPLSDHSTDIYKDITPCYSPITSECQSSGSSALSLRLSLSQENDLRSKDIEDESSERSSVMVESNDVKIVTTYITKRSALSNRTRPASVAPPKSIFEESTQEAQYNDVQVQEIDSSSKALNNDNVYNLSTDIASDSDVENNDPKSEEVKGNVQELGRSVSSKSLLIYDKSSPSTENPVAVARKSTGLNTPSTQDERQSNLPGIFSGVTCTSTPFQKHKSFEELVEDTDLDFPIIHKNLNISTEIEKTPEKPIDVDGETPKSHVKAVRISSNYQPLVEDVTPVTLEKVDISEQKFETPENSPTLGESIRKSAVRSKKRIPHVSRLQHSVSNQNDLTNLSGVANLFNLSGVEVLKHDNSGDQVPDLFTQVTGKTPNKTYFSSKISPIKSENSTNDLDIQRVEQWVEEQAKPPRGQSLNLRSSSKIENRLPSASIHLNSQEIFDDQELPQQVFKGRRSLPEKKNKASATDRRNSAHPKLPINEDSYRTPDDQIASNMTMSKRRRLTQNTSSYERNPVTETDENMLETPQIVFKNRKSLPHKQQTEQTGDDELQYIDDIPKRQYKRGKSVSALTPEEGIDNRRKTLGAKSKQNPKSTLTRDELPDTDVDDELLENMQSTPQPIVEGRKSLHYAKQKTVHQSRRAHHGLYAATGEATSDDDELETVDDIPKHQPKRVKSLPAQTPKEHSKRPNTLGAKRKEHSKSTLTRDELVASDHQDDVLLENMQLIPQPVVEGRKSLQCRKQQVARQKRRTHAGPYEATEEEAATLDENELQNIDEVPKLQPKRGRSLAAPMQKNEIERRRTMGAKRKEHPKSTLTRDQLVATDGDDKLLEMMPLEPHPIMEGRKSLNYQKQKSVREHRRTDKGAYEAIEAVSTSDDDELQNVDDIPKYQPKRGKSLAAEASNQEIERRKTLGTKRKEYPKSMLTRNELVNNDEDNGLLENMPTRPQPVPDRRKSVQCQKQQTVPQSRKTHHGPYYEALSTDYDELQYIDDIPKPQPKRARSLIPLIPEEQVDERRKTLGAKPKNISTLTRFEVFQSPKLVAKLSESLQPLVQYDASTPVQNIGTSSNSSTVKRRRILSADELDKLPMTITKQTQSEDLDRSAESAVVIMSKRVPRRRGKVAHAEEAADLKSSIPDELPIATKRNLRRKPKPLDADVVTVSVPEPAVELTPSILDDVPRRVTRRRAKCADVAIVNQAEEQNIQQVTGTRSNLRSESKDEKSITPRRGPTRKPKSVDTDINQEMNIPQQEDVPIITTRRGPKRQPKTVNSDAVNKVAETNVLESAVETTSRLRSGRKRKVEEPVNGEVVCTNQTDENKTIVRKTKRGKAADVNLETNDSNENDMKTPEMIPARTRRQKAAKETHSATPIIEADMEKVQRAKGRRRKIQEIVQEPVQQQIEENIDTKRPTRGRKPVIPTIEADIEEKLVRGRRGKAPKEGNEVSVEKRARKALTPTVVDEPARVLRNRKKVHFEV